MTRTALRSRQLVSGSSFLATTGVTTPGSGNITLNAAGTDLNINEDVTSMGGSIDLDAANSVVTGAPAAGPLDITTTGGGAIDIDGGLNVRFNGTLVQQVNVSAETGNITINGGLTGIVPLTPAAEMAGVELTLTTITTSTGNVALTGTGGLDAVGNNDGIEGNAAVITSTSGNITFVGTGGAGGNSEGVEFEESLIQTSGNISATGEGGADAGMDGRNSGVDFDNGTTVSATGSGTIALMGTGGAIGDENDGVQIQDLSVVRIENGNLNITAGGGANGDFNFGLWVVGDAVVESTGSGQIIANGTGGANGADENVGISIEDGALIDSQDSGTITLTGIGGGTGDRNFGVRIAGNLADVVSEDGMITINGTGGGSIAGTRNAGVLVAGSGRSPVIRRRGHRY